MKTVTLCGSTRFKDKFMEIETIRALRGWAVYSCSVWGHSGATLTEEQKLTLDAVHMVKIANSDLVYVINVGGYVGESTRREVYFAVGMGKHVQFHEPDNDFAREWTRR